jgi:hypothetical protein
MSYIDKLPEKAFATLSSTGETILVKRGEKGYFPQDAFINSDPNELNERLGVTKAEAKALYMGSMFGFDAPASDPDRYDENGEWIR